MRRSPHVGRRPAVPCRCALKHTTLVVAVLTLVGCSHQAPAPSDPTRVVRAFMDAVKAGDLEAMGRNWGTSDGPAPNRMEIDVLGKRLQVMHAYLEHESYEVVGLDQLATSGGRRTVRVRLRRRGCTPVVPFIVIPYRDGWLVEDIDLTAANPTRVCT